jgi:anti-sigma factor RsiW
VKSELHARAKKLIVADRVEGISADERDWLDRHLANCDECSTEASRLSAAIQTFRAVPMTASPDLVRRTSAMVLQRTRQKHTAGRESVPLWIATATSAASMASTAPFIWSGLAWIGRFSHTPEIVWQTGFLLWWFMPATILAAAAAWRRRAKQQDEYWRQQWQ